MRLLAELRTDFRLQARNQLIAISVGVSMVVGGALSWLASAGNLHGTLPLAILMFVGGSTLLYVVAMILLEKEDGTLDALAVSPLKPAEYLASKVLSLTALATLEAFLIAAVALGILSREGPVPLPNPALLLLGAVLLGAMHVLVGIILVVRYERISEAILPMGAIALVLQLPAFWFLDGLDWPPLLLIPSAAPTLLIRAALTTLTGWQWAYAVGVSTLVLAGLSLWSLRAYERHIVAKGVA